LVVFNENLLIKILKVEKEKAKVKKMNIFWDFIRIVDLGRIFKMNFIF